MKVQLDWTGNGLQFKGKDEKDNVMHLDGNSTLSPSPMTALLFAIAGCTGADVVSLMEKMHQPLEALTFEVEGFKRNEGDYPRMWETIHIIYKLKGNLEREKVEKAVNLSMGKYCSVSHMLKMAAKVTWEIQIN